MKKIKQYKDGKIKWYKDDKIKRYKIRWEK